MAAQSNAQQTFEELVAAVKQAESRGKRYAADGKTLTTSPKGALGEMQVMPKTIKDPGFGVIPAKDASPDEIARVGVDYLQAMTQKYGDTEKALIAYNWGPGSTDKWIAAGAKPEALPAETRTYVQRVKGFLGKDVSRETMAKKDREPLPESLPPMAKAPESAVVAKASSRDTPDIKSLPASYQAAFALAALADAKDDEDDKAFNEFKETESEKLMRDYKPVNYLASLDLSVQPIMMNEGGEVEDRKRPDDINYFSNVNRMKDRGTTTDSVMLGASKRAGEGSLMAGLNMANMSRDEKLQTARALMLAYTQQDPEGLGINANIVKPEGFPAMANVMGSLPLGEGRVSAGMHGNQAYSLGYNRPVEGGQFNANLTVPRGTMGSPQLNLRYEKRFANGGDVKPEPTARQDEPFFDAASRTFVDVLTGRRTPITEKDFTAKEQLAMMDAVKKSQARGGKGRVDYQDYPDAKTVGPGYVDIRNTLGGFQYKQNPDGSTVITDRYDFHGPRVAEYEKMGTGERLVKSAKNALVEFVDKGFSPRDLAGELGRAYIGSKGPEVNIRIPVNRANGGDAEPTAEELAAASTPAFIAQKSGIGRRAGPVSRALQSGQGYVEAAKGFTMLPQNLVGGAFDLSNMIANVYGGGVEKPIFGSENLKEQSRKAGLAFKPSDDPTLAAFFGAGDLGSNLVNPAGVTRTGVKAAEKTGKAIKGTASDLLAKYQATQAPKPKVMTDLMTGQQFEVGGEDWIRQQFANIQAQRAANSTNVLGDMPRMQTPQTQPPVPVGWGEIDVTPGETLAAEQALRAQRAEREAQQAAQNAQQQLALPLEVPVEPAATPSAAPARVPKVAPVAPPVAIESAVTPSNPFVGRLDNFVSTLKGPVTKDQLLGQLRGKFRDYDLSRVEQALEDLKPADKIKPADLKQRLDGLFSPRNLRLGIVEPNPQAAGVHHLGMDNPFIDDKTKQMGVINLLMETPKEKLLAHRETADVDRAFAQLTGFTHTPDQVDLLKDFFVKSASPEKAATLTADLDALVPYVQKFKEKQAVLVDLENSLYYPILSKKWGPAQNQLAQQHPDLWANFQQYKPVIDEIVIQDGLKSMQVEFGITPPPFSLYKQDKDAFNAAVKTALTPVNNEMAIAKNNTQQAMVPVGKEIEALIQSKRLYKGQHPNLNEPYKQNNPVAFSRFTDHEAVIGDQGPKSGMYIHELQSDRFDDLVKKGPKGGSPEKDKKELIALNIQVRDKINMPIYDGTPKGAEKYAAEIGPAQDRANIFNKAADAISIKSYDKDGGNEKINALIATYPDQVDLIKDALKIAQRQKTLSGYQRTGSQAHQIEESFAGMETSPQVVQQLLVKNAIVAAMQRGKEFVAFPGKESAQAQLYEKLPANLKQVIKDLGPGFEIRPIELPVRDVDAINTLGVTWSPEAAARILKTGVPFKKGGMVERKTDDNRRYL
jgi:hypothetical protein